MLWAFSINYSTPTKLHLRIHCLALCHFSSVVRWQNVTERTAMQNTAVYAYVRVLAEGLAELPLHIYQYTNDGDKHPLYFLLHDAPNPEMTSFIFRETLMNHLLLWGNAYAQIIRNGQWH